MAITAPESTSSPPRGHHLPRGRRPRLHTRRSIVERGAAPRAARAGQIRVKVEASGLCHTDIHAAHGDWPVKPSPPFVPGPRGRRDRRRARPRRHRGRSSATASRCRGSATRAAPATTASPAGRRSASSRRTWATRSTAASASTRPRTPATSSRCPTASTRSTRRRSPAPASRPTRRSRSPARARPISSPCSASAGSATWRSSTPRSPAVGSSRSTSIDEKLELARELGAEFTVNAAKEDPVAAIQALGGADQAIALAVSPQAFEQAYGSLRRGGTLVFVALPADNEVELPIFETVLNGITIVGSIVGTRADLREVFELHAAGKTTVIRETAPARAGQRVDRRRRGRTGRRPDRVRAVALAHPTSHQEPSRR